MKKITPKEDEVMVGIPEQSSMKKEKTKKIYPRLRLEHQFFPETKKWEVGKTYKIELELEMTGLSISKFQNDSEFDITGYEIEEDTEEDDSKSE